MFASDEKRDRRRASAYTSLTMLSRRIVLWMILAAIALGGAVGCGGGASGASGTAASTGPGRPSAQEPDEPKLCPQRKEPPQSTKRLVGLRLAEARRVAAAQGCSIRVIRRDGRG